MATTMARVRLDRDVLDPARCSVKWHVDLEAVVASVP